MYVLSSFAYPHVISKPYDFLLRNKRGDIVFYYALFHEVKLVETETFKIQKVCKSVKDNIKVVHIPSRLIPEYFEILKVIIM